MQKWSAVKERGGMLPLMLMLGFYRLGGRWLCRVILYFSAVLKEIASFCRCTVAVSG